MWKSHLVAKGTLRNLPPLLEKQLHGLRIDSTWLCARGRHGHRGDFRRTLSHPHLCNQHRMGGSRTVLRVSPLCPCGLPVNPELAVAEWRISQCALCHRVFSGSCWHCTTLKKSDGVQQDSPAPHFAVFPPCCLLPSFFQQARPCGEILLPQALNLEIPVEKRASFYEIKPYNAHMGHVHCL